LKEKGNFLKERVVPGPLKAQRRWRSVQVRLECAGHVGLIGKPATRRHLLDRQTALRQQASGPIDAPLDNVSVRGSVKGFTEAADKKRAIASRQ
jgi:hypothetical protein